MTLHTIERNIPHELVLHPPQPPASSFVENRPGSPGSRGQRKLVASAPPLLDAPVEDDPPIPVHTDTEPHSESAVPIAEDQENLEKVSIEEKEVVNTNRFFPLFSFFFSPFIIFPFPFLFARR